MSSQLLQRRFLQERTFQIVDTGINVCYKNPLNSVEYHIKFESIGTTVVDTERGVKSWLFVTAFFIFISGVLYVDRIYGGEVEPGAEFFYLSFALAALTIYVFSYKRSRTLTRLDSQFGVEFFKSKGANKELNDFIDHLLVKRKAFLTERFAQLNRGSDYDSQLNNLKWLLINDVLDQAEYDSKVAELNLILPRTTVVRGFVIPGTPQQ